MENYFELFGIPVQLTVNTAELRPRFFALSRQFHPDFYVNRSDDEQVLALEKTAQLNKAWKIFQQPDDLLRYVLEINGAWHAGEKYDLSSDFLLEMMEINEALMDGDSGGQENTRNQLQLLQASILEPVKDIINEAPFLPSPEKLSQLKEYFYRRKYLQRIEEQLNDAAKAT